MSDQSEILPPSSRPPLDTLVPQWTQGLPAGAVDRWVEAQGMQNEDGSEWEGSLDQLFQDGAGTAGARIDYSACVASVASSRQGHSLHKALTKLQQAI